MPHPDATAALLSGHIIAGYVATAPFTAILKRSDKVHVVTTSKQILGEEMTGVALGAGKKFVDANPTVARVVIAATRGRHGIHRQGSGGRRRYLSEIRSRRRPRRTTSSALLTDGSIVFSVAPAGLMKLARFHGARPVR